MSENSTPQKKRRFYHNLMDAYRIAARTYPWIGWLMIGVTVVATALGVLAAALIHGSWFSLILLGLLIGVLISTILLSTLTERATYAQVEGTVGQVYMVISRIRSGWIANQQPIAANPEQDLVWRLIGRPGIVLISEGPSSRVRSLLEQERKKAQRIMRNVTVTTIEVGTEEGQVRLAKLQRELRSLKKTLTRDEVPLVNQRLSALDRTSAPIPKGIDPTRMRPNRRALRGR